MNRIISACLLAAAVCWAPMARAAVLFERSLVVDRSVNIFTTSHFDLKFVFGDSFLTPSNPAKLFDGASLTPTDIGKTFTSLPGDPAFSTIASRLTDGRDDFVKLMFTETSTGRAEQRGWRESGFFVGHPSNDAPDLQGAIIQALKLRIDSFSLGAPGASTTALSLAPPVDVQMTFTVIGTIPEPATATLGALAFAALAAYTVRRRSSTSA
jgi:hypothetical protein